MLKVIVVISFRILYFIGIEVWVMVWFSGEKWDCEIKEMVRENYFIVGFF